MACVSLTAQNVTNILFGGVHVGHQPQATGDPKTAGGARAQVVGGVHSACRGSPRGGGRANGGLKPEVMVMIGGDRPPRLGGDVVSVEDIRELRAAYSEYKKPTHITNQYGGDRVLARTRELVDSTTQMIVAD